VIAAPSRGPTSATLTVDDAAFEGTLVLEQLAAIGKVEDFFDTIDSDGAYPHAMIAKAIELASPIAGPPYDPGGAQELCDILERILGGQLASDETWPSHEWLDGFSPQMLDRDSDRVIIRGGIWVSAVRPEPCEVEIQLVEPRRLTFRFMDATGPSDVPGPWRLKFPPHRTWRYIFHVEDRP
jgi:hypothetical protein